MDNFKHFNSFIAGFDGDVDICINERFTIFEIINGLDWLCLRILDRMKADISLMMRSHREITTEMFELVFQKALADSWVIVNEFLARADISAIEYSEAVSTEQIIYAFCNMEEAAGVFSPPAVPPMVNNVKKHMYDYYAVLTAPSAPPAPAQSVHLAPVQSAPPVQSAAQSRPALDPIVRSSSELSMHVFNEQVKRVIAAGEHMIAMENAVGGTQSDAHSKVMQAVRQLVYIASETRTARLGL